MTKVFDFQRGDLNKLRAFYKKAPKMYKWARVALINNLAFRMRGNVLNELEQSMTIRSPGFVKGSVRVQKARFSKPVAEVGSIRRERFSGWMEQETGKKTARKRIHMNLARSGNWKRRVAPRFRFKSGSKRAIRPSDLGFDNTRSSSVVPFLQILDRRKYRQPWFLPVAYKRMQRGIYIFRAKKIRRVQDLNPSDPQPKKNPWMTRAIKSINQAAVEKEWQKALDFSLSKMRL